MLQRVLGVVLLLCMCVLCGSVARGAPPDEGVSADGAAEEPTDGEPTVHRFKRHRVLPVPVIKVEPGAGFTTGLRGRYVYREQDDIQNRITLDLVSRISVRLVQQHEFRLRMRDLAGHNEIFDVNFRFESDPVFTFAGVANHAPLSNRKINEERFEAHRMSIGPDLNAQFALGRFEADEWFGSTQAFLRAFVGWNFAVDRFRAEPGSLFADEAADFLGTSTRGTYYVGLTWDSRNNDWNPKRGGLYDMSVASGGPWAGGSTVWSRLNASFRNYQSLGSDHLVLAHELLAEIQGGDVPMIPRGEFSGLVFRDGVGGLDTGRGYFRRRFIGKNKVFTSAELRIEPFMMHLGPFTVEPGIKPFIDLAWVQEDVGGPFADALHVSGGAGVYVVWDQFEVIRMDFGISPEGAGFVMAADHAF